MTVTATPLLDLTQDHCCAPLRCSTEPCPAEACGARVCHVTMRSTCLSRGDAEHVSVTWRWRSDAGEGAASGMTPVASTAMSCFGASTTVSRNSLYSNVFRANQLFPYDHTLCTYKQTPMKSHLLVQVQENPFWRSGALRWRRLQRSCHEHDGIWCGGVCKRWGAS